MIKANVVFGKADGSRDRGSRRGRACRLRQFRQYESRVAFVRTGGSYGAANEPIFSSSTTLPSRLRGP